MRGVKITINYDRKKIGNDTTPAPVVVEAYFGGRRKYFDTGVRITPDDWNARKQAVQEKNPLAKQYNKVIDEIYEKVKGLTVLAVGNDGQFSLDELAYLYKYGGGKVSDFYSLLDGVLEVSNAGQSTKTTLRSIISTIKDTGLLKSLNSITAHGVGAFDKTMTEKGLKPSYIKLVHSVVRRGVRLGMERGVLAKDPYTSFRVRGAEESRIRYLSKGQIEALHTLEGLNESCSLARDKFLLQVYTGMAVSDLDKAVFDLEKGVLRDNRRKTGTGFVVKLMKPAKEILESYGGELPKIGYQWYRQSLRKIGEMIGVSPLTSHMARHTFATTITLSNKVPLPIVSKMLGHTNITTTQRYVKVLVEDVLAEFDRLDELLDNKQK